MLGGSGSSSLQLFLALCVVTGLAAVCVLLATAGPLLASTPAELRGGLARRLSRVGGGGPSTLRRLSGAAKGQRKADGPPPAGITVSYTAEEGYRSQEGQDKWVDQQIFHGKRWASLGQSGRACSSPSQPHAWPGLPSGPCQRALAAAVPPGACPGRRRFPPPLRI